MPGRAHKASWVLVSQAAPGAINTFGCTLDSTQSTSSSGFYSCQHEGFKQAAFSAPEHPTQQFLQVSTTVLRASPPPFAA